LLKSNEEIKEEEDEQNSSSFSGFDNHPTTHDEKH
jgi:hypothetical protein